MSEIPPHLRYAKTHEWVELLADGSVLVGITDYAQSSLGDITFVQAPKAGVSLKANEPFGVVESVKAASDVYSPLAGVVFRTNAALEAAPELLNQSPYKEGWIMQLRPASREELGSLLSPDEYAKLTS